MTNIVALWRLQIFSGISALVFLLSILHLVKNKKLREEYALLWIVLSTVMLALSLWRGSLEILANFLGIAYAPAALFLAMIFVILLLLLHITTIISSHKEKIANMIQELALLKYEVDNLVDKL